MDLARVAIVECSMPRSVKSCKTSECPENSPAMHRWSLTLRAHRRILPCMCLHVRFSSIEKGDEQAQTPALCFPRRRQFALAVLSLLHPPSQPRL